MFTSLAKSKRHEKPPSTTLFRLDIFFRKIPGIFRSPRGQMTPR